MTETGHKNRPSGLKRFFSALLFPAALFAVILLLGRLTEPKYASGEVVEGSLIGTYYEHASSPHEVLFIGDCEAYEAFSPVALFNEYGVTSYIRGTAQQLIWQSRQIFEETLTYETPKVLVLAVCPLRYGEPQKEAYNRMTLDGMKLSIYKLRAIEDGLTEGETLLSYLFPLLRYHDRITELTEEDFEYLFKRPELSFNGYLMHTETVPYSWLPTTRPETGSLPASSMEELDIIVSLCREKGIRLILVKSPALYPAWSEKWDAELEAYANEKGVTYVNANDFETETGIDWSTDTMDGGMHLNVEGAEKLTQWLYRTCLAEAGLTDYRNHENVSKEYAALTERYEAAKANGTTEVSS